MESIFEILNDSRTPAILSAAFSLSGVLASILAFLVGIRRARRPGSPEAALAIAILLLLPLVGLAIGTELSRFTPPSQDESVPIFTLSGRYAATIAARTLTGAVGLALTLPLGVAAGLWAGIAAARRSRRAGERARLAAVAAGYADAGQHVAVALDRSSAHLIGAIIGLAAGVFVGSVPALGLLISGLKLSTVVGSMATLDDVARLSALKSAVIEARELIEGTALIGGVFAVVIGAILGGLLHVRSSRRRNLAVALQALQATQADKPAIAAVTKALAATGKPRPLAPAAIALLLLVCAGFVLARAAIVRRQAISILGQSMDVTHAD